MSIILSFLSLPPFFRGGRGGGAKSRFQADTHTHTMVMRNEMYAKEFILEHHSLLWFVDIWIMCSLVIEKRFYSVQFASAFRKNRNFLIWKLIKSKLYRKIWQSVTCASAKISEDKSTRSNNFIPCDHTKTQHIP